MELTQVEPIRVYQTAFNHFTKATSADSFECHIIFDSLHQLLASLLPFEFLKMASQLNSYRNFIDIKTKEGQSLLANAIEKFTSPLAGDERIALIGPDFQKLKDNISRLGSLYGPKNKSEIGLHHGIFVFRHLGEMLNTML